MHYLTDLKKNQLDDSTAWIGWWTPFTPFEFAESLLQRNRNTRLVTLSFNKVPAWFHCILN